MRIRSLHRWDVTPAEARDIQHSLKERIETDDRFGPIRLVAGVDVGFPDKGRTTRAAVAVLTFPDLEFVAQSMAEIPTLFPYVPGLLSFREVPAVLAALERLRHIPDIILCDGQGTAHPRRFGIACHLGLICDTPAIGVAKSRLTGEHAPVPEGRGESTPLILRGETIGAVLRTRVGVRPLFVSPGHRISLDSALDVTLRCTTRYRLPETTRWADRIASGR
ncbi:MAG: deoxyribonuclease V [Gammaproteobacteria bacterium]|jgi:deoxyribonuclease V|nr:deoxyribonuclease V [Gammaproteobacteria bacterium]